MNVTLRMLKNPKWSHPASIERTQLMHYVIIIIIKITNSSIVIGLKNSYFPLYFTCYYYYKDDATKRKIGMYISPRSLEWLQFRVCPIMVLKHELVWYPKVVEAREMWLKTWEDDGFVLPIRNVNKLKPRLQNFQLVPPSHL